MTLPFRERQQDAIGAEGRSLAAAAGVKEHILEEPVVCQELPLLIQADSSGSSSCGHRPR